MSQDNPNTPNHDRRGKFRTLSLLWIVPSLGSIAILTVNLTRYPLKESLSSPRIEDIVAILILGAHVVLLNKSR